MRILSFSIHSRRIGVLKSVIAFIASLPLESIRLIAESRPREVATYNGKFQARLPERPADMRAREMRGEIPIKTPRIARHFS